jgi:thymidylate synthase (FAD)
MKLVKPSYAIARFPNDAATVIESIGRVCYKSEDRITEDSASKFTAGLVARGHLSVIEHLSATVRFVVDRGVSHELVRHRLASYSQESTRYCDYGKGDHVTFVIPPWCKGLDAGTYDANDVITGDNRPHDPNIRAWMTSMATAEQMYLLLRCPPRAWSPQQARSVLPNSLKTEIVMTANLREWMHVFKLRCAMSAHSQMLEVMVPLWVEFAERIPELFAAE